METESAEATVLVNKEILFCDNCDKDARDNVFFFTRGGDYFDDTVHSDGYVCGNCGITYMAEPPRRVVQVHVSAATIAKQNPRPGFKGTYRRRAHINERLSSAHLVDPVICDEDLLTIKNTFLSETRRNWLFGLRYRSKLIGKRDIQTILRRIDKKVKTPVKRNFCVKYLEKWKTLKHYLEGSEPLKYTYEQTGAVGAMFVKISNAWDDLQPPADKETRKSWKFSDRRHIPNFNFLFRRIHTLLGPEYKKFDKEFPVPRNEKAIKKLWVWWRAICEKANLPENEEDKGQGYIPHLTKTKQTDLDQWIKKHKDSEKS